MNNDIKKVYDKINKLLAMAERNQGNEEEAATAAKMVEKLLRKYNLSMKDITPKQAKSNVTELRSDKLKWTHGSIPIWVNRMAIVIGDLCDCFVISKTATTQDAHVAKRQSNLVFVGMELDANVANDMFMYLYNTIIRCTEEHFRENKAPKGKARTYMSAYRDGMSVRLRERLRMMIKEKEQEYKSTGTALMVVKKDAISTHLGYELEYNDCKRQTSRQDEAFAAGYQKGNSVNLNKQLK